MVIQQISPAVANFGKLIASINGFRLTGTTATPVTTADVSNITTLYYTPYISGQIGLYDGYFWQLVTSAEVSLPLGTLTAAREYNVYAYSNSGTLTLEFGAAATAGNSEAEIGTQDGVKVKSADHTRRYIGRIYTSSTTQTQDTATKRFVSNMYNRVPRMMKVTESTANWSYTTGSWRQANNSATNQIEFVSCEFVYIHSIIFGSASTSSATSVFVGIGLDTTSAESADGVGRITMDTTGLAYSMYNTYDVYLNGYHKLCWIEFGSTGATFYGSGGYGYLSGSILG